MKKILLILLAALSFSLPLSAAGAFSSQAKWISKSEANSEANTWLAFRKRATIDTLPSSVTACIAADTKYWLWINGNMVVREGGLKRGPAPGDSYYDKVEIAPYLKPGENLISILVWYMGRNSFSHAGSGTAAMIFDAVGDGVHIFSDGTWEATVQTSFGTASGAAPNYRLSESNILFDARKYPADWYLGDNPRRLGSAFVLGYEVGSAPFGKLVERPVPLWKDFGMKSYLSQRKEDTRYICTLPYNAHVTPYLKVKAPSGKKIRISTDHEIVTGNQCVFAEYITKDGEQEFECFGWMNGEKVFYDIPEEVQVQTLMYRESGYDTEFSGSFVCDDPLLNEYCRRAQRTLYVCMRDTYYDCPDRERAQWWGDEVNELALASYALSPSAHSLALKGARELARWQRPDKVLHSPCPTGNYFKELPMQMLLSVGWLGFRAAYMYSADSSFVEEVYPAVRSYLHEVWEIDENGFPKYRKGDWDWLDGNNKDTKAFQILDYYLALKGEEAFALMLGKSEDAGQARDMMNTISANFNKIMWNGSAYRSPDYSDLSDDRVQALAVICGIADREKYDAILKVLEKEYHVTSCFHHLVLEALMIMGRPDMALERMHRYYPTLMLEGGSTLCEQFNFGGTSNHAWSGGGFVVLSSRFAGIRPLAPGFRSFEVDPQMGPLNHIEAKVDAVCGQIGVVLDRSGKGIRMTLSVPDGTKAVVRVAAGKDRLFGPGTHKLTIKNN